MKKLFLAFCVVFLLTSSLNAAELLFESGFESGVTIDTFTYGGDQWYSYIEGADASGYDWDTDMPGDSDKTKILTLLHSSDAPDLAGLEAAIDCEIQTVTGPLGESTKAFYIYNDTYHCYSGCQRVSTSNTTPPSEYYVQYYMKLNADFDTSMTDGSWYLFWEQRVTNPSAESNRMFIRKVNSINGSALFWTLEDYNDSKTNNTTVSVPLDQWFKFGLYYKHATDGTGRITVFVNDEEVFAREAATADGGSAGTVNLLKAYSNMDDVGQWMDDFAIYDGIPDVAPSAECGNLTTGIDVSDASPANFGQSDAYQDKGVKVLKSGGYPNGCQVSIKMVRRTGDLAGKTVSIKEYTMSGDNLDTEVADYGTIDLSQLTTSASWPSIIIADAVAEGNAIVIDATTDASNYAANFKDSSVTVDAGAAADLQYFVWDNTGTLAYTDAGDDMAIRIYESDGAPPSAVACTGTITVCTGAYSANYELNENTYQEVEAQGAERTICGATVKLKSTSAGNFHLEIWDAAGSAQIGGDSDTEAIDTATFDAAPITWSSDEPVVPDADFRVLYFEESGTLLVQWSADSCYGSTAYEFMDGATGKNYDAYLELSYAEETTFEIDAIGTIVGGAFSENPTETWNTVDGTHNIALRLNDDVSTSEDLGSSVLTLTNIVIGGEVVSLVGCTVETISTVDYLQFVYTGVAGHRVVGPTLGTLSLNGATIRNGDDIQLDNTLSSQDLDGSGAITIAMPDTTIEIGTGKTYATPLAATAAGWYPVGDDTVTLTSFTGNKFFWTPGGGGTSGHPVIVDATALTGLEGFTLNLDYADVRLPSGLTQVIITGTGTIHDGRN